MTLRPWHVVAGWGVGNLVLAGILFGFHESLWPELLYLAAGLPLALFAAGVWYSDHISHSGVRTVGGSAIAAVPFAFGCALIGLGLIYATWIALVGVLVVLATGVQLVRSAPARLPPPVPELARLPVKTLDSPPTFSTAALEEDGQGEEEPGADEAAESGRPGADRPTTTSIAVAAGAAAWVVEIFRARRRRAER